MSKVWKSIPQHPSYKVSSDGEVYSDHSKRLLKPDSTAGGYLRVKLGSTSARFSVHRLVLLAFVGPSNLECNHKNGLITDNRLENLEYCTKEENNRHCCRVLRKRIGTKHVHARFSTADIENIRSLWASGTKQVEIAKLFSTRQGVISNILSLRSRAIE